MLDDLDSLVGDLVAKHALTNRLFGAMHVFFETGLMTCVCFFDVFQDHPPIL